MASVLRVRDALDLSVALAGVASLEQDKVVVVCTVAPGRPDSDFRPDELAQELPDDVAVVVVPHYLTAEVKRRLGPDLEVFNGAARVYPVAEARRPYRAMVYLPDGHNRDQPRQRLIAEARRAAAALRATPAQPAPPGPTVGAPAPTAPPQPGTGPAGGGPDAGSVTVLEVGEVSRFAEHLTSPARSKPVVLISRPAGSPVSLADSARIADQLGGLAEVYEIPTGAASWALTHALAGYSGVDVYGGASRVYPLGADWLTDPRRSPLRFIYSETQRDEVSAQLIADASSMAFQGGYRSRPSADTAPASGAVTGIVSGRAIVKLERGGLASIWPELTAPDVDAEHLFRVGMPVRGLLDSRLGRLDVSAAVRPVADLVGHHRPGDQVPARVLVVEPDLCVVELVPGMQVDLGIEDILDTPLRVDLRQWLTPGEVLTVAILEVGADDDQWRLSVLEVDRERATLPAPSLLAEGPPWLTGVEPEDDGAAPPFVAMDAPEIPAPLPPAPAELPPGEPQPAASRTEFDALRVERDSLASDLLHVRRVLALKDDELRERRARAREANNEVAKLRRRLASSDETLRAHEADRSAFVDPEEQLRYELHLAWARRIPAAEKAFLAPVDFELGPDFLDTLRHTAGIDRTKVIDVMVDVLTGRVHQFHGRATHQLRTGHGGSDPFLTRADGATCWRVSLQHKTPQARRLHYWQLNDGSVEFSSIRLHDDIRP